LVLPRESPPAPREGSFAGENRCSGTKQGGENANHLGRAGGARRRTGAALGRTLVSRRLLGRRSRSGALRHRSRPCSFGLDRRPAETSLLNNTRRHERRLEAALGLSYTPTEAPAGKPRRFEEPRRGTQEFRGRERSCVRSRRRRAQRRWRPTLKMCLVPLPRGHSSLTILPQTKDRWPRQSCRYYRMKVSGIFTRGRNVY
jgi:hypothetical protein